MRKKELEEKIDDLEALVDDLLKRQSAMEYIIEKDLGIEICGYFPQTDLGMEMSGLTSHEYYIRREKSKIAKIEDKICEYEKTLQETVLPYIEKETIEDIGKCLGEIFDTIDKAIKTGKNVKKDTEKPTKNVGKKTTKKKEGK